MTQIDFKLIIRFIRHIQLVSEDKMVDSDLTGDELILISNEFINFK